MAEGSAVSDPQHAARLLRALSSFREEARFCDAHLVLDGEEIPVQKNILAAASPYIRTKLNYNPPKDDGSTYKIELEGISVTIMREILDYIFSGQIRLNEDTIQDVVQAADLLLLTDLKTLCCEFLEGCIAAENCIGIRDFALHYCLHHVHYLATEYLETHFRDVSSTEEFLELSPQKLKEVISLEKLNVGNERYVFEAVIRWIAHDVEMRKRLENQKVEKERRAEWHTPVIPGLGGLRQEEGPHEGCHVGTVGFRAGFQLPAGADAK